tara:strand:- start:473 stop:2053 length:1581 start_codon:yes stop_codon:yes gene_type:complete
MKHLNSIIVFSILWTSNGATEKPNILFILADDLGFSDLGCYGGEIETPHLDALAKNGLRYTQFYNTGRCWPSRAALLTGYYPHEIHRDKLPGVKGGNRGTRQSWAKLLPEYLQPHGYRSYHSGKWHIDGKVLDGGFDRSYNTANQGNFFSSNGVLVDDLPLKTQEDESNFYVTTATADHAIDCLQDHAANYADQPFFHYLAFIAPHFPLHALPEDIEKYRYRYLGGWDQLRKERFAKQKRMGIVNTTLSELEPKVGPPYYFEKDLHKLGPEEVYHPFPYDNLGEEQKRFQATKMAIHAAMIDRMDVEIGRVIDQLKQMGAFENTIICFASDNGASAEIMVRSGGHDPSAPPGSAASYLCLGPGFSSASNTPFRRHKTWVHEGGTATPFIVHWSKGIKARGELRRTPGHVIDFVPTIMDIIGSKAPTSSKAKSIPPMAGESLAPSFQKDVAIDRNLLWWMHDGHRAVRVDNWKLVADEGEAWELYDLKNDRAESVDLSKSQPEKAKALERVWERQLQGMIDTVSKSD